MATWALLLLASVLLGNSGLAFSGLSPEYYDPMTAHLWDGEQSYRGLAQEGPQGYLQTKTQKLSLSCMSCRKIIQVLEDKVGNNPTQPSPLTPCSWSPSRVLDPGSCTGRAFNVGLAATGAMVYTEGERAAGPTHPVPTSSMVPPLQETIDQAATQVCRKLKFLSGLCKKIMRLYLPRIAQGIMDGKTAREVCVDLRMCKGSAGFV
ncbi:LOW QUALITY PROTEIN: granulysin [Carlito syrichta]|uniref:LOW QUALITY PROTEIN: granulysin n=1 Tax=Carlito syrichta TaxID=1868482 RepID=A0A3Q0DWU0_CARSF|nr:LOW QUALITY PROTEIN: granulysin [Carlito syrichta]